MSDFEHIEKILRLKRYEQPPEGYYEGFVEEFWERQRGDMLRRSAPSIFFERVGTWISGFGNVKWVYAAGTAYAIFMISLYMGPREDAASNTLAGNSGAGSDNGSAVSNLLKVSGPAKGGDAFVVPVLGDEKTSDESVKPVGGAQSVLREF